MAHEGAFRRQIHPGGRALADLAGNGHAAPMVGDDAIDQRQAQAAMGRAFGGEKGFEHPRQRRLLDARAVVANLHADVRARRQAHIAVLGGLGQFHVPGFHGNLARIPRPKRLHGILQQFGEGLLDFRLVIARLVQGPFLGELPGQPRPGGAAERLQTPVHHGVEVAGRRPARFVLPAE